MKKKSFEFVSIKIILKTKNYMYLYKLKIQYSINRLSLTNYVSFRIYWIKRLESGILSFCYFYLIIVNFVSYKLVKRIYKGF